MKTEENARKCWCPNTYRPILAQQWNEKTEEWEHGAREEDIKSSRCIASDCMAWRWSRSNVPAEAEAGERVSKGYCGLAGKPA